MKAGATGSRHRRLGGAASLRAHWPEYLMEAAELGIFMVSAGAFTTLLYSPASPASALIPGGGARRALVGLAMGATAVGLIYSPWGKRSGAHMNPAITLTFLRLGKIPPWDACYYVIFQVLGGFTGVLLTAAVLGPAFTRPPVDCVVTVPGPAGPMAAFGAETVISSLLMGMIVGIARRGRLAAFTGLFSGVLIFLFVAFESPYSGFGMNPARTFASALPSGIWTAFWIYLTAPLLGMLLSAQVHLAWAGKSALPCCKLDHRSPCPCIFCGRKLIADPIPE